MKQRSGYVYHDKITNTWVARTTLTDETGKRRNIKRNASNKSDAKRILRTLLRRIDDEGSRSIDTERLTFNTLADHYDLHYLKPAEFVDGRKISGLQDWKHSRAFLAVFRQHFGKHRLREITHADIRAFRSKRLGTPTQYKRHRSITTLNRELASLRRILNVAVHLGWLSINPFTTGDSLISIADERKRERVLTIEEEKKLLDACEHPKRMHLRPLLICLLDTGARKSELLKLRWSCVSFSTRTITLEGTTTKTLKTRKVAITERMSQELERLWEESKDSEGRVFGISDNVRKAFASACKEAGIRHGGIDGLTLHCLRHTAATRLVKGKLPIQMVGRILGHSQPQTTYRYLSADSETVAQAAAILERVQESSSPPRESVASELVN
jgi:integrase